MQVPIWVAEVPLQTVMMASGRHNFRSRPPRCTGRLPGCLRRKPIVGAIEGAAIGGGLGLAMVPDFRVACPEARFSANFVKLGIHQGFGLSVTLPRLIGCQAAHNLLLTGRRIGGEEALKLGLVDQITNAASVRGEATLLAREIAANAPLAVQSVRATLRGGLAEAVANATEHELKEQGWLRATQDAEEGILAVSERRAGHYKGM